MSLRRCLSRAAGMLLRRLFNCLGLRATSSCVQLWSRARHWIRGGKWTGRQMNVTDLDFILLFLTFSFSFSFFPHMVPRLPLKTKSHSVKDCAKTNDVLRWRSPRCSTKGYSVIFMAVRRSNQQKVMYDFSDYPVLQQGSPGRLTVTSRSYFLVCLFGCKILMRLLDVKCLSKWDRISVVTFPRPLIPYF